MIRPILIADNHPICAEALKGMAQAIDGAIEVSIVSSIAAAEAAIAKTKFAALLLDLALSDSEGLANLSLVRARKPDLPVLVVSSSDAPAVISRVQGLGARGFVSKQAPVADVRAALSVVLLGGRWFPSTAKDNGAPELERLSPAQTRVMVELGSAKPNKLIAHNLHVTEATVKSHLTAIYRALGVSNRSQAILALRQMSR